MFEDDIKLTVVTVIELLTKNECVWILFYFSPFSFAFDEEKNRERCDDPWNISHTLLWFILICIVSIIVSERNVKRWEENKEKRRLFRSRQMPTNEKTRSFFADTSDLEIYIIVQCLEDHKVGMLNPFSFMDLNRYQRSYLLLLVMSISSGMFLATKYNCFLNQYKSLQPIITITIQRRYQ